MAQKPKLKKEIDRGMCDRFTQCYHDSGLTMMEFAAACGQKFPSVIHEIGRYEYEPSKGIILNLYHKLGYSPNFLLLGIGPKIITELRS